MPKVIEGFSSGGGGDSTDIGGSACDRSPNHCRAASLGRSGRGNSGNSGGVAGEGAPTGRGGGERGNSGGGGWESA